MSEGYNGESFEVQVMERLTRIEEKLDGYGEFKKRFYDAEKELAILKDDVKENLNRIKQLESRNQWLSRRYYIACRSDFLFREAWNGNLTPYRRTERARMPPKEPGASKSTPETEKP